MVFLHIDQFRVLSRVPCKVSLRLSIYIVWYVFHPSPNLSLPTLPLGNHMFVFFKHVAPIPSPKLVTQCV